MGSSGFFVICILHSVVALTCGALMMFYVDEFSVFAHGNETASKLLGSTPHDQLLIQISHSFAGLLLFAIGFLLFMVAFVRDREFQSFFAIGCVILHVFMALWRFYFERRLEDLARDWPRQFEIRIAITDEFEKMSLGISVQWHRRMKLRYTYAVYALGEGESLNFKENGGRALLNTDEEILGFEKEAAGIRDSFSSSGWPMLYASVLFDAAFGLLFIAAVLIVLVLTYCGKPCWAHVLEGRKITNDITRFAIKIVLKEGNIVAAVLCSYWVFRACEEERNR
ncbi:hypothetical protein HHK36_003688 [Tetracentron sinense]|uniref:DUF7865 domain-containing protein n=1 Tax=Tetracentron sinense TaxID=13715 RepID=A0A834ZTB2_TETSI|nr:hypothetical protein HHK36_003688 [Tetracentron sinense]